MAVGRIESSRIWDVGGEERRTRIGAKHRLVSNVYYLHMSYGVLYLYFERDCLTMSMYGTMLQANVNNVHVPDPPINDDVNFRPIRSKKKTTDVSRLSFVLLPPNLSQRTRKLNWKFKISNIQSKSSIIIGTTSKQHEVVEHQSSTSWPLCHFSKSSARNWAACFQLEKIVWLVASHHVVCTILMLAGWTVWCVIWLCASSADDTSSSRSNNPKRIAFVHLNHGWLTMSLVQHRSSRDHGWSLSHSSPQAARRRLTTPDANNTAKTTIPCNLECCTLLSSSSLYKVGPYDTVSSVIYLPDSIDGNVDIQIVIGLLHLRCCTTRRPSLNNARGHCLLLISPGLPT